MTDISNEPSLKKHIDRKQNNTLEIGFTDPFVIKHCPLAQDKFDFSFNKIEIGKKNNDPKAIEILWNLVKKERNCENMPEKVTIFPKDEMQQLIQAKHFEKIQYCKFQGKAVAILETMHPIQMINITSVWDHNSGTARLEGEAGYGRVIFHAKITNQGGLAISHLREVSL